MREKIYAYRYLIYFFAWRDILLRYKQALLGVSWALLRPLLNMILFTMIFGKLAHLPSSGVDYSLFVLAAMLPWQFFTGVTSSSCQIFVHHAELINKVYFPRYILPIAQMAVHLIDFFIGLLLFFVLSLFSSTASAWSLVYLLPFMAMLFMLCMGLSFWVSLLTVKYHDFHFIIPFLLQAGILISPVGYGSFMVPDEWLGLYLMNPLVGIIDGFRWAFFGITPPYFLASIVSSLCISASIFLTGCLYFRSAEKTLVDWL